MKLAWLFCLAGLMYAQVASQVEMQLGTPPPSPAAGKIRIFPNIATGELECIDSDGTSCWPNETIRIGPELSLFNAFDQTTAANTPNLITSQDTGSSATSWGTVTFLHESSNTVTDWAVGLYSQSTAINTSGAMKSVVGAFGEADSFASGTGSVLALAGVEGLTENHSNTTAIQTAFTSYLDVDAGATTSTLAHFYGQTAALEGGSTVVNYYGIFLPDITGATTLNKAIHTGAGWVGFGDVTSVGSTAALPLNLLYVKGPATGAVSAGYVSDANTFGCIKFGANTACAIDTFHMAGDGTNLRVMASTGGALTFGIANVGVMSISADGKVNIAAGAGVGTRHACWDADGNFVVCP